MKFLTQFFLAVTTTIIIGFHRRGVFCPSRYSTSFHGSINKAADSERRPTDKGHRNSLPATDPSWRLLFGDVSGSIRSLQKRGGDNSVRGPGIQ